VGKGAATIVAHDDAFPFGAVVPPIFQSSLFTFADYDELAARFRGEGRHPIYSRVDNPTAGEFERSSPPLRAPRPRAASPVAWPPSARSILGLCQSGDRIVCVRHVYPDSYRLMRRLLPRFGIAVEFVDGGIPWPSPARCRARACSIWKPQQLDLRDAGAWRASPRSPARTGS
jgi:O-acetylhomoserine/O-acetylserine sulfhydrylase-like pyridoxal-dependent enzyme